MMARWVGQQEVRLGELLRFADAEERLQRIADAVRGNPPSGVRAGDVDRFLARHADELRGTLMG